MILFNFPSFLIDRSRAGKVGCQIAADQIAYADTTIFVCKDLFDQQDRKRHLLQINGRRCGFR